MMKATTVAPSRSPLRPSRTPFIGRARERAALAKELRGGTRLLTITGPSGMGKTRLAREVMRELAADSAFDAVEFCSLVGARSRSDVEVAVARILGPPREAAPHLDRAFGGRPTILLALDNVDALAPLVAPLVEEILEGRPQVQLLLTSVVPLGLELEVHFELGRLEPADAVALYLERAHRIRANLDPEPDDRGAVEELVTRLDRIPLAIELAAARSTILPARALLSQMNQRFELLQSSRPGRQGSLFQALSLTWELLSPLEQVALARISVFVGGFSLEAAEALLGSEVNDVISLLDGLRSKAFLQLDESASDEPRFSPYESVREYSALRLAGSPDEAESLRRHREFFLREGERHASQLEGLTGPASIRWLTAEQENLLAAHRRCLEQEPALSARLGLALGSVLEFLGPHPAEIEILDSTLLAARTAGDPTLLVEVLRSRGHALVRHGRLVEAEVAAEEAARLVMAAGDRRGMARILGLQSVLTIRYGDHAKGMEQLGQLLEIAREESDPGLEARAYFGLGMLEESRSRFDEAIRYVLQALAIHRRLGNLHREATACFSLGATYSHALQFRKAREATEQARALFERIGDRTGEGYVLINLGAIHLTAGNLEEAERYTTEGLQLEGSKYRRFFEAQGLLNLGLIAFERGEVRLAEQQLLEALALYEEFGDKRHFSRCLTFVAAVEATLGRTAEARRSLEEARRFFARIEDAPSLASFDVYEGILAACEARELAASAGGPTAESASLLARAREHYERARSGTLPATTNLAIGTRLLERALSGAGAEEQSKPETLIIGPEGRWFEATGGERIDLRRRQALRAMLMGLVRHRLAAPGSGLSLGALFEIGWEGEVIQPSSASKRVYTAIWSLRSLGLSTALVHQGEGYMIDPEVSVVWAE